MPYSEMLIKPMREDLSLNGITETRTPEAVDAAVKDTQGTLMIVVNSVCGCAAGKARPGIVEALLPHNLIARVTGHGTGKSIIQRARDSARTCAAASSASASTTSVAPSFSASARFSGIGSAGFSSGSTTGSASNGSTRCG